MYEVSVIIPNFNGKQYLKNCLDAMKRQVYRDFEVILVDNGSEDGSADYVREHYPEVHVLTLQENRGFCGGVNAGIQASESPYVVLLNNDTIAEKYFLKNLVSFMKEHPGTFSCQAKMLKLQDRDKIDDAGNYYCALGWAFADGKGKPETRYNREKRVFSACAGAAIYDKRLLEKTGLFDEVHFAYLEDLDIGYRARLLGYENWFCPKARVYHVGSGTSGSRYNLFKVRYSSRNNIYMIYKNMPLLQIIWNFPLLFLGFSCKALFFARKGFGREYLAGIKNGIALSRENQDKKVSGIRPRRYVAVQWELYKNIIRFLRK
nr:glycosyltransferase family 2 protein [uncultured Blautia sp.]